MVHPIVGQFCVIHDNVKRRNHSGADDQIVFDQACKEYQATYNLSLHIDRVVEAFDGT